MDSYEPEDVEGHFYYMHNVTIGFVVDLDRHYPRVEIVDSLVDEAIAAARMCNNTATAMMLDDTQLVYQFVKTAHACRRSRNVNRLE